MQDRRTLLATAAQACVALPWIGHAAAAAAESGAPAGPAILTVSGSIRRFNDERTFKFDRAMLERLGTTELKTSTAWTAEAPVFEGVLARTVLDAVGAKGDEVAAIALNDYAVGIPTDELLRYPILLALKMNGEYLKIKDKGPLWIVYPRDQYPELKNPMTDKKWVWQLNQIEVH